MKKNSILVISNNIQIGNFIRDKVKLLRECDTVKVVSFIEAIPILHTAAPALILLYCENAQSVDIIKAIRTVKTLDKIPLIFITDSFEEETVLAAFDRGIDDFFSLVDPDSVILMRIFLTLQKSLLYQKYETASQIMTSVGIIDKETGLYAQNQVALVMKTFFQKAIEENSDNTLFLIVKLMPRKAEATDIKEAGSIIKKTVRGNDITAFANDDNFYLILNNSALAGIQSVYARLKSKLNHKYDIYCVASHIKFSFDKTEYALLEELVDLIMYDGTFKYVTEDEINNTIKNVNEAKKQPKQPKNYKKELLEKVANIITPAFESTQKYVTINFKTTKTSFITSENESSFTLKKGNYETEIIITYPTYTKLVIIMKPKDKEREALTKKLIYRLETMSADKLYKILTELINNHWS